MVIFNVLLVFKSNFIYLIVFLALIFSSLANAKPADWQSLPWIKDYEAGLKLSAIENRPVFIYFQAKWCSWCHVYEQKVLSDPIVMKRLKNYYTLILINYDARPDLFQRYVGVGLPHSVVLTPKGKVVRSLTGILSVEDMMSVLDVSRHVVDKPFDAGFYTIQAKGVDKESYHYFHQQYLEWLDSLFVPQIDKILGQFGKAQGLKQPSPRTWLYLMEQGLWQKRSEVAASNMVQRLWDEEGGGFFYFVDHHRADKHLETAKLLQANAWLILWLADAGQRYQNPQWLKIAQQGITYLHQTLWDNQEGGFYQAQFADEKYFALDKKSRKHVLPPPIDRIKLVDSNAQAAFAFIQLGESFNDRRAAKMAIKTVDYLLEYHYQDGKLYRSREDNKVGSIYNLPKDLFWLLMAGNAVQSVFPKESRQKELLLIKKQAALWLKRTMKEQSPEQLSPELIGLIAQIILADNDSLLPVGAMNWVLQGIRIEPRTWPDELVFSLRAWQQYEQ